MFFLQSEFQLGNSNKPTSLLLPTREDYRLRAGWFLDKYKGAQIFHYKSRFPDFETRHVSKLTFFRQLLWRTFKTKLYSSNGLASAGYECRKKFFHCNHWGTSVSQKKRIQPSLLKIVVLIEEYNIPNGIFCLWKSISQTPKHPFCFKTMKLLEEIL